MEHLGRRGEREPFVVEARRRLLAPARGRVLEVGAGPGFNLPHYPHEADELVVTDRLPGMVARAERRARAAGREVEFRLATGHGLPFEDGSFDTVVASFLLCSVDDQGEVLEEIGRVLRPGGRYLFLEHVRSDDPGLARRQDRWEAAWKALCFGCRPNRDTLPAIRSAFDVQDVERSELPSGPPRIVRPYVLGRAAKR
jgi:ubiquinone/menaquinone biosynthesis C-methylase UbiE